VHERAEVVIYTFELVKQHCNPNRADSAFEVDAYSSNNHEEDV
jgi:hypothetical protein